MQEGDLVLGTVDKIVHTTVFVKIQDNGVGTIITSEVAPGRIRNLRDYVVPGKKIVCKVLKIDSSGNIHLSLRRVSNKEKKEVMDRYEKEKGAIAILKNITPDYEKIAKKIEEKITVFELFNQAKENPSILDKYFKKEEAERILTILKERKEKEVFVKSNFKISSEASDGLMKIKEILKPYEDKITYLAAGRYTIKITGKEYKKANSEMNKILDDLEKKAKALHIKFERER
jgi:translation initiation factor 2 subunit 1